MCHRINNQRIWWIRAFTPAPGCTLRHSPGLCSYSQEPALLGVRSKLAKKSCPRTTSAPRRKVYSDGPTWAPWIPNQNATGPLLLHNLYNFCNGRTGFKGRRATGHRLPNGFNTAGLRNRNQCAIPTKKVPPMMFPMVTGSRLFRMNPEMVKFDRSGIPPRMS